MTFGEKIKKLRTDNGMTQEELSEQLLVTRTAISKWETGNGYPSIDSLLVLSRLFHVSIDELLSDDDIQCQRLLEEKRARRFYWAAVLCLLLTAAAALVSYFCRLPALLILSAAGMVAYILCALAARPRYKRLELKKRLLPYILGRVVLLLVVAVILLSILLTL